MTVISALSEALATFDRALSAGRTRRGAGVFGRGTGSFLVPVPQNQPIRLSGEDENGAGRVVTYADTVAKYPVVFGVWSKILRDLATTDVGVYRDRRDGKPPERVYGTSLEKLLHQPAPGKGLINTLQWLFNPYLVEGNGLLGKYRGETGAGTPKNLIPLDWRYMSALARPGGPVEQWISFQVGDPRPLDPSEVIHFAWDSPDGCSIGTSPLHALDVAIRLEDASQQLQIASFDNGGTPGGALVIPADKETTPEERTEMREAVEGRVGGIDAAFSMLVLSGGVEWKPLARTALEVELTNTRNVAREDVCIAYGIHRSVIQDSEHGADLDDTNRAYHRALVPHTRLLQQVLQRQLIDPEDEWASEHLTVRFDLSELVRGTYREESEVAVNLFTNGLTSRDESRKHIGMSELGGEEDTKPFTPHAQLDPNDGRRLPANGDDPPARPTPPTPTA